MAYIENVIYEVTRCKNAADIAICYK